MREMRRSNRTKIPGMAPKTPPKEQDPEAPPKRELRQKRTIVLRSSSSEDETESKQQPVRKSIRRTMSSNETCAKTIDTSSPTSAVLQQLVKHLETKMDRLKRQHEMTVSEKDVQINKLAIELKRKEENLCKESKRTKELEAEIEQLRCSKSQNDEDESVKSEEEKVVKKMCRNRHADDGFSKKKNKDNEEEEKEEEEDVESLLVPEEKDVKSESSPCDIKEEEQKSSEIEIAEVEPQDGSIDQSKGRHEIRKVIQGSRLSEQTKIALREEKERRERVKIAHEKREKVKGHDVTTRLALDVGNEVSVEVHKKLVRKLKPHQAEAVEFLWDSCIESLDQLKSGDGGSGCVLAHCMGLGKTLSTIAFIHTLMKSKECSVRTTLIVSPLNTVLNWQTEWTKWLDKRDRLQVFEMTSVKGVKERAAELLKWHQGGGVIIMGYQLFRLLVNYTGRSKRTKEAYDKCLIDPGPDVIVCDEGHILKNNSSAISKAICRIRSKRRIVLTGTPLQNNLIEYHCMVNFVKPNLLGSRREFSNRFVNPITNGQHLDSTVHDVKVMKRRSHVLHEMLAGCVQRKNYSDLTKLLPSKHEYVLSVRLSKLQIELYTKYLAEMRSESEEGARLFADYQSLMRIWTHPWVLKLEEMRMEKQMILTESDDDELASLYATSDSEDDLLTEDSKEDSASSVEESSPGLRRSTRRSRQQKEVARELDSTDEDEVKSEEDEMKSEEEEEDETNNRKAKVIAGEVIRSWQSRYRSKKAALDKEDDPYKQRMSTAWWQDMLQEEDKTNIELSGKLVLLRHILQMTKSLGEKLLVFSQSLLSLDLIEMFLSQETEQAKDSKSNSSEWNKEEHYLRLDGSTLAHNRKRMTEAFNNPKNPRLCLLLISTKAGGLGINLEAANRVIIFDASWNPSHDVQSIFRVYRFGQERNVYVYRFLAQGTMEEKIYERQVTKETLSQRVIDEQQVDRHFTQADLQELYKFNPDCLDDPNRRPRPTPAVPKDVVLAELLTQHKHWITGYHEHESLLERRPEEDLSEEERKDAWDDYEREKSSFFNARPFHSSLCTPAPMPTGFNLNQFNESLTDQPPLVQRSVTIPPITPDINGINHHIAQLPKVVQEILKYNPSISADELKHRLQAFLGMHVSFPRGSIASGIGHIQGTSVSSMVSELTSAANAFMTQSQLPQTPLIPSSKPP